MIDVHVWVCVQVKLGQELQAAGYFDHVTKAHRFKDAALYYRFSVRSNACHTSENDRVGFD